MEGRDTLQEGNKPAEEPQMKETAQPDNSEKTGTNQEQANNSEKSETWKDTEEKKGITSRGACSRCGKFGHRPEDCIRPVVCGRCKKEGHVPRVCDEVLPWECIAPFVGLASSSQGFHVIQSESVEDNNREMANCALIRIMTGSVTARQLENEFKAQSGPQSTWRWFAKKVSDSTFQMRFPTAKKVEELSFFTGMQMGTVPDVTFKVEPWNANAGAKGKLESAWFRVFGLPIEKRSEKKVCLVASLVGLPLEVDKSNLKRWDFVRVKIGCRDVRKVPAMVESLLDFHFYDFTFQREVPTEGITNAAGTRWTRNSERHEEDSPSPKKPKRVESQEENRNLKHSSGDTSKGKSNEGEAPKESLEHDQLKQDHTETNEKKVQQLSSLAPTELEADPQDNTETIQGEEGEIDNDEQGQCFDDFISPGGEHFTFGSFQNVEIRNLWKMDTGVQSTTVINEYGTNMFKSKSDPLIAVEAKQALLSGKHSPLKPLQEDEQTLDGTQEGQVPDADDESTGKVSIPSPYNSTQETVDWSSQELPSQDQSVTMENQPQTFGQRQSNRLREQGNDNRKIAEKAETHLTKKNLEGNSLSSKNSFAVLENSDIIIRAGKLGIDSTNLNYEKIDMLRELERARAGLIEKKRESVIEVDKENTTSLPSEEVKFLEWYSENSEDEGFQLVSSRKTKRKKKSPMARLKKKIESSNPPPLEGEHTLDEGVPKISSGYNLREKRIPKYKHFQ